MQLLVSRTSPRQVYQLRKRMGRESNRFTHRKAHVSAHGLKALCQRAWAVTASSDALAAREGDGIRLLTAARRRWRIIDLAPARGPG